MVFEFDGTKHGKLRDMQAARRAKHPDLVRGGMNLPQAAHAAGAFKRTGKAWRNGRTRPTGRNERPRKTPDHMKPSEKTLELTNDTATSTPTDTINTNRQQRCCDDQ